LPEDFFVKSVRQGTADVLEQELSLTGATGNLELVISANGGRIEGTVVDDQKQAASGATVVLVPEARLRARGDLFKATTTDQYGAFKLRGVPPGDYKLFAWEDVEVDSYKDPAFLEPYEKQGRPISVHEKSHEQVELPLIPATH
jgi:carboxypeptidase family protein